MIIYLYDTLKYVYLVLSHNNFKINIIRNQKPTTKCKYLSSIVRDLE